MRVAYRSLGYFSSNINQYGCVYVTVKIAKQCCNGKNFIEQISIKFGGFYVIKMNLVQILRNEYSFKVAEPRLLSILQYGKTFRYKLIAIFNYTNSNRQLTVQAA